MKIYQMQTISTILWVLMGLFLASSVAIFFACNIRKAWKIVVGTNFKVPVIKGLRGSGLTTAGLGTRNLNTKNFGTKNMGTRNMATRNMGTRNFGSRKLNSADLKSRRLASRNLESRRLNSSEIIRTNNISFREMNSNGFNSGGNGMIANYGETVSLDQYLQSRQGEFATNVQKGMVDPMETSVLINYQTMNQTNDYQATTVLKREEFELVMDFMFIHTEEEI